MDPGVIYDHDHDAPTTTMRKKKRAYGEYVDQDTGEVSIVQTTKQVKRNHQKSGKWYKEPTEAELRIWERDEKRQAAVEKAQKREENKKINASKRAEKEEKEQQLKRQQFEAGRITFTQTLAKKDEDQLNLHSWFGGRSKVLKKEQQRSRPLPAVPRNFENKEDQTQDKPTGVADVGVQPEVVKRASQLCEDNEVAQDSEVQAASASAKPPSLATNQVPETKMDFEDLNMQESTQDFDIAEDSDADTEILDQIAEEVEQQTEPMFKIPALPKRLPLSPMSKSDVNVRASQAMQVSSFKGKLENASIDMPTSTQAVRDLLSGICTQDLADDMNDADDEESFPEDKENHDPDRSSQAECVEELDTEQPFCKAESTKPAQLNQSFDSCDYDTIFAELEDDPMDAEENKSDDFTGELRDTDLLSLPSTQLLPSTKSVRTTSFKNTPIGQTAPDTNVPQKPTRKQLKKNDSFAIEGLSEDDLDELYDQFEKHERKGARASTVSSFRMSSSTASSLGKKRVLPWERPDLQLATLAEDGQQEASQEYEDA